MNVQPSPLTPSPNATAKRNFLSIFLSVINSQILTGFAVRITHAAAMSNLLSPTQLIAKICGDDTPTCEEIADLVEVDEQVIAGYPLSTIDEPANRLPVRSGLRTYQFLIPVATLRS
jgi:hypothetical protein